VLYDTLNDDDDDIRCLGARAVSFILQKLLVPQAANQLFAKQLLDDYRNSPIFAWNILCRLTGTPVIVAENERPHLTSADVQFERAFAIDHKLFTEEKQNLFVDCLREVDLWTSIFQQIPLTVFGNSPKEAYQSPIVLAFVWWVTKAVEQLNEIVETDGALGWSSKPEAFTFVVRAISCANVLLDYFEEKFQPSKLTTGMDNNNYFSYSDTQLTVIIQGLDKFISKAISKELHSMIVQRYLSRQSLDDTTFSRFGSYKSDVRSQISYSDIQFPLQRGSQ